jgi:lipoate-protein ligase A
LKELRVLLYESPDNPYYSLAFEEALFRSVRKGAPPTLRFWRHSNAVIIGYFQKAEEEVNIDFARRMNIAVARRFTGGGAVYHDLGCLLWTIATRGPEKGGVSYLYDHLLEGFVNALRRLGFNAFRENVNDVVVSVGDRAFKVSGAAGSFREGAYLLHGTLLLDTNLEVLSKVLKVSKAKLADKRVSEVKYRVINLSNLGIGVDYSKVVKAVVESYSELLDSNAYLDVPGKDEVELARRLYEVKYSKPEWNLLRFPHSYFEP